MEGKSREEERMMGRVEGSVRGKKKIRMSARRKKVGVYNTSVLPVELSGGRKCRQHTGTVVLRPIRRLQGSGSDATSTRIRFWSLTIPTRLQILICNQLRMSVLRRSCMV